MSSDIGHADEVEELSESDFPYYKNYDQPSFDGQGSSEPWSDAASDEMSYGDQSPGASENDDDDSDDTDMDGEMGVRALTYDPSQLTNSNGLPMNGHDYLKLVQEERERLPAIVSVPPPPPTANLSAKKSTQSSAIPMDLVLHCDEEIDQGQCMQSQQSSTHPMDTSVLRESQMPSSPSYSSSSLSSDENDHQLENNQNSSVYSGMASKEFREQLRLKSIGCTSLNMRRKNEPTLPASIGTDRDLLHRDQILANFLKLRSQIDSIRGHDEVNPNEICDIDEVDEENKHQKNNKRGDKSLSRNERRANNLIRVMNLGHPPDLDTLVNKSQRVIHSTLDRLADQCEKAPIYSTLHADWIYSLMALLREPIEPNICSTLRRLAKLCITRREGYERRTSQSINGTLPGLQDTSASSRELVDAINDEEYYGCLLIICIVRYHFGQADLR